MLLTPESIRQRRKEIVSELSAGTLTEAEAGARLIDADPDFGGGYLLLAHAMTEAGDLAGAESCYWKALFRMPCDYSPYFSIMDVRRKQFGEDDPVCQHVMILGTWKLSFYDTIPDEVVGLFTSRPREAEIDVSDPFTYEMLATAQESTNKPPVPAGFRDRLLPFQLLNEIQRQSPDGFDQSLLRDLLTNSERLVPLCRSALRGWVEFKSPLQSEALGMMLALIGETAGPESLGDLLDLVDHGDPTVFLHANWAVWRMGQRFPAETLAGFRTASAGAHVSLRCALAEHIDLLPETPGMETVLAGLLEGFAGFAKQDSASYLLLAVTEGLRELGHAAEVGRLLRQFSGNLPRQERALLKRSSKSIFVSRLIEEEIDGVTIEEICQECIFMPQEEDEDEEDFEDEEEGFEDQDELEDEDIEYAPKTVVAPPKPARNEPCWCGSGKKYKKCHLQADEQSERAGHATANQPTAEPLHKRLQRELSDCLDQWRTRAELEEATRLYFGAPLRDLKPPPDQTLLGAFIEWYVYDFRPAATGRTLPEEYLRRRGAHLTPDERELMEAWRDARFGIWEAQRIEVGKGVELRDLFAGDHLFLDDVNCSRSMVQWDCIQCRIYRSGGRWYGAGIVVGVPRHLLPKLTERIQSECRETGVSPEAFVRANSHRLHRLVDELSQEQWDNLRLRNVEGDEIEFCAAQYLVRDEAPLIAALQAEESFVYEKQDDSGGHTFAWLEQGDKESRRSYGHIHIRRDKLRLECNSRHRLETGRSLIENAAGAWLQHQGDSIQSQDAIKRRVREENPKRSAHPESSLPPEVEREIIGKWKSEHYRKWVDEPLPALDGMTPRQAAQSKSSRQQLEDLLRTMENKEERERLEGRPTFDFSVVRKQLGL